MHLLHQHTRCRLATGCLALEGSCTAKPDVAFLGRGFPARSRGAKRDENPSEPRAAVVPAHTRETLVTAGLRKTSACVKLREVRSFSRELDVHRSTAGKLAGP